MRLGGPTADAEVIMNYPRLSVLMLLSALPAATLLLHSFPDVLHRFDRHLDVIGRAGTTRRKYRYELLRWWTDYLFPADLEIADVLPRHVEEYLGGLPRHGSRRGDALRALRPFLAWAQVEGEI